jgi:hypothetical protein
MEQLTKQQIEAVAKILTANGYNISKGTKTRRQAKRQSADLQVEIIGYKMKSSDGNGVLHYRYRSGDGAWKEKTRGLHVMLIKAIKSYPKF